MFRIQRLQYSLQHEIQAQENNNDKKYGFELILSVFKIHCLQRYNNNRLSDETLTKR